MAFIDPEGLFNGDRMAMLSDEAKLMWPYFWCASSQSIARIELNYRKVLGKAFHHFKSPPTEAKFWAIVREYRDCYLLFIYKYEGSVWGQWDTSARHLGKYQTAADRRMPAPPQKLFSEWKQLYVSSKQALHATKSTDINLFEKVFEGLEKFSEISDKIIKPPPVGDGVGVGIGGGEGNGAPPPIPFPPPKQPVGCRRFLREYPGEVKPDWDTQIYISTILTTDDEQVLFHNLELWKQTSRWLDGFIPSAENFLRKGHWKHPPKANAIPIKQPEYPRELI